MSTVIASGVVAVPTNYIEMISSYITSVTPYVPLDRRDQGWIYDHFPDRSAGETPGFIAREGSNFIFGPSPSDGITVKVNYYNRLAPLSTAVNSVFTSYPGLWLYGALLEAEGFLKNDKRIPLWGNRFAELLKMVQDEDDMEEFSGSTLAVRPG